jgi:hypothetical protein
VSVARLNAKIAALRENQRVAEAAKDAAKVKHCQDRINDHLDELYELIKARQQEVEAR